MSKLSAFYHGLPAKQQQSYAEKCRTSTEYLRIHLIPKNGVPDRVPRRMLMESLAEHSDNTLTIDDVLAHYYSRPVA